MSNSSDHPAYPSSNDQTAGLTKRELIAAMCLQGILANPAVVSAGINENDKAYSAILHADSLLSQLEKNK